MTSQEIRAKFLAFFEKRGHAIIPSAPLVPENDPSVLFNTAGMQPLVPFLMGRAHPNGDKIADVQKCVRTNDIEEVGDNTHLTFFEMLGNWSLGAYFKEDAIQWSYELLVDEFKLDPRRLYVTCFEGDENAPQDTDSATIWKKMFARDGIGGERIFFLGAHANWWPAVKKGEGSWTGPTGPCTEMFYDVTGSLTNGLTKEEFLAADEKQQVVEIWNDVFMEYVKDNGKITGKLEKKNVDTGSGLERVTAVIQGVQSVFDTDLFKPILEKIQSLSSTKNQTSERIIADHIRTAVFMISDGVTPSNTDQGYILRRLLRRAIRHADILGMGSLSNLVETVITTYKGVYDLKITDQISVEEEKFRKTLKDGIKQFEKGEDPFILFSTYGFPIELTLELAKEKAIEIDLEDFNKKMKAHQDISRAGSEQKFKGGLADTSEQSVRYHTATHLLHYALRKVLGEHVQQKGSNITPERLRFDFVHPTKMTDEEKKKVEDIVNEKIQQAITVENKIMLKEEAVKIGALHFFNEKYPDQVSVYFIGDSIEFCGGPHVKNTKELGVFKIAKEEAVSAGVRRIKAILS
ncbi:MAG: alanine--tRNA ligase [Candidatus Pacebacteria bacterium]|nr:alanine--tRNA ligase [Candidatus Paceibacterota bacterium]